MTGAEWWPSKRAQEVSKAVLDFQETRSIRWDCLQGVPGLQFELRIQLRRQLYSRV